MYHKNVGNLRNGCIFRTIARFINNFNPHLHHGRIIEQTVTRDYILKNQSLYSKNPVVKGMDVLKQFANSKDFYELNLRYESYEITVKELDSLRSCSGLKFLS